VAIYLWPPRLADALRDGALSESDKLVYLAAGVVLSTAAARLRAAAAVSRPVLLFDLMYAILIVAGVLWCYRANRRGDGQRFIERFVILSVPVSIATYLVFFATYYGLGVGAALAGALDRWPQLAATLVASLIATVTTYWWLGRLVYRAAAARTA
jgi:hypothetical protein